MKSWGIRSPSEESLVVQEAIYAGFRSVLDQQATKLYSALTCEALPGRCEVEKRKERKMPVDAYVTLVEVMILILLVLLGTIASVFIGWAVGKMTKGWSRRG